MAVRRVRVRALAKINLSLRIAGVHADGYHELRTIFQSIALHDTLTFTCERGDFRIVCDDPSVPNDSSNLVWRAADAMWRAAGRRGTVGGVSVRIAKRVPARTGLGGGSSDGAAALRAFASLWRVDVSRDELLAMAASLGADVPYFLEGGTVLGLDRGDDLFPLADIEPEWVVLALPRFGVSTSDAFGWWDADVRRRRPRSANRAASSRPRGSWTSWRNDLESPVAKRHPPIARLARALRRFGAWHAAMTGSGSAVFGLFSRRSEAESARRALEGAGIDARLTRTVNRAAYQRLAGIAGYRIHFPFAPRNQRLP